MSQPEHLHALTGVPMPTRETVSQETGRYWDLCQEKLGLVPNVIRAYSFDDEKLGAFTRMYNELMLGPSGLSKLEREMIAVVVSSVNRCFYCLTAHGAAVRELSNDPALGELLAMNYRTAELDKRTRAMLDFAWKLAETPAEVEEADRQSLREAGFSDLDIWDIASITAFFSMSNRMSSAIDLQPNPEYHSQAR
ncbi:MAG: peroxidase-related enzyme [Actinobacteria bacterium]|nr:peroxidase-related enzyme [Acidimicrobiia bacterium]MCA1736475.1 peroxidase-related enzyme [Actinomycetota bacterium]MDQ3500934.1 peroxidase-related enzyme [Actinomycetota bacterium]